MVVDAANEVKNGGIVYARERHNRKVVALIAVAVAILLLVSACALLDAPPKATIAITDGSPYGPAPLTVTFDISGSSDPDGEIVSFTFDFGDGTAPVQGTDLTQPIEHTYTTAGSYVTELIVVDDQGKSTSLKTAIMVTAAE